jgi:hypothetical protein
MGRIGTVLLAILVVSCANTGDPGINGGTTPILETPHARESLTLSSRQPLPAGDRITGMLGADAVEGGCAYLAADDGTRYEVVYPTGWTVRLSPLALLDPSGEVFAEGGDAISVRGGIADDMASICQIGPIFRATEVGR